MTEAEGIVVREQRIRRAHEILADERDEIPVDRVDETGTGKLEHGAAVEDLSLDCRTLDHCPLVRRQAIEPLCQERLDRRRDGNLVALAGERGHLLEEERIS